MRIARNRLAIPFAALIFLVLLFEGSARQQQLPDGEGKEVFINKCGECHGLENATSSRRTQDEWTGVVNDMAGAGALLSKDDMTAIVGYLWRNFGKININKAAAAEIESFLNFSSKDAQAIVAYRTEHGSFKSIDDLKKVTEIDVKILDEKKTWIAF